jgi:nitrous oxidase accessory protein
MDSAVLVNRTAERAVIRGNHLTGNLFGVYLHGAAGSLVENNVIVGRDDLRTAEAGNGVSIWNAPGAQVIGNTIRQGRDGIFVNVSKRQRLRRQHLHRPALRHPLHVHQRQPVIGNRSKRQPRRLGHHVFRQPGDPRQRLRSTTAITA